MLLSQLPDKICWKCKIWKSSRCFHFMINEQYYPLKYDVCLDCFEQTMRDYYKINSEKCASFKLKNVISSKIRSKTKIVNSVYIKNVFDHLEYTPDDLKIHLQNRFELWMNWSNWGRYIVKTWNDNDQSTWKWQIDHIIPQSKLIYTSTDDENFKKCWALKNLRPYSAKQNLLDSALRKRF